MKHTRHLLDTRAAYPPQESNDAGRHPAPQLADSVMPVHPAQLGFFHLFRPQHQGIANPAAGAQPAGLQVPAGEAWLLLEVTFTLATLAIAGNRSPWVQVIRAAASGIAHTFASPQVLSVNETVIFTFARHTDTRLGGDTLAQTVALGDTVLLPGDSVRVFINGIQATDQVSSISVVVAKFSVSEAGDL